MHSKPSGQRQKKPEGRAHSDGNAVQVTADGWRNVDVDDRELRRTMYNSGLKVKVKEADLYSAFIEVPYTQVAQVRMTDHTVLPANYTYLPLPRKHSPDGASQTEVADI